MMQKTPATVATPSAEVEAMQDDIGLIADVRTGLKAMRAKASVYLPRYSAEDDAEWRRRVACAPWRPEFNDILLTLASKPFSRAVGFADGAPAPILRFADDVDARGNCLHVFARKLFLDALANGVSLVLIDYPQNAARTLADEKRLGLRPHWAHYAAEHIIACRATRIGGRERILHQRGVGGGEAGLQGLDDLIAGRHALFLGGRLDDRGDARLRLGPIGIERAGQDALRACAGVRHRAGIDRPDRRHVEAQPLLVAR